VSTRASKSQSKPNSEDLGLEGNDIPTDFEVPSCTIEDVDRSIFELFDKQLPFQYKHGDGQRRAPVIYASGERFAVLRRKKPLRDKSGALILPLVSIMRTNVQQTHTYGGGMSETKPVTIRRKLSEKDPIYQRLINENGLLNSDDLAQGLTPTAGRLASRSRAASSKDKNIYEVITLPPVKYFTATYEVTFWAQYTQQMNDMMSALMHLYQWNPQRTFRLETPKGYWFVGYVGEQFSSGDNFDSFTDEERLVRYSFEVTVPAYQVSPQVPGLQSSLRRFVSSPDIVFEVALGRPPTRRNNGIDSAEPGDHALSDLRTVDDPIPGQSVGPTEDESTSVLPPAIENVGGSTTDEDDYVIDEGRDPMTGKIVRRKLEVKTRTNRRGETVLRQTFGIF
jgi:hypothetical protein